MKAKNRFGKRQIHRIESARGWAANSDHAFRYALDSTIDERNRVLHLYHARLSLRAATTWLDAAIKAIEDEGAK